MPATLCSNSKTTDILDSMCGNETGDDMTKEHPTPPADTSKQHANVSISKYYDILTPEEDDILSISHDDIMSNKCEVSLEKLSNSDLDEIKATLRNQSEDSSSSPSSLERKPTKKVSLRLCKRPSTARMRAQRIINAQNAKIRCKEVIPHPYKAAPVLVTKEPTPPSTHDSSDDTILYTPPSLSLPNRLVNRKRKAKFIIRRVGIKNYRDKETVVKANARKRSFKCYLCQQVFQRAKTLTTHFKDAHEGLDCLDCGQQFTNPMSLKKHSYYHKACVHKSTFCDKTFPFPSQKAFHERIHTNTTQHRCPCENCSSSFGKESDLKSHLLLHDAQPIKCAHCEYTNTDIQNVRQHSRVHSDVRPYKCTKCDKHFKFAMQKKCHSCQ